MLKLACEDKNQATTCSALKRLRVVLSKGCEASTLQLDSREVASYKQQRGSSDKRLDYEIGKRATPCSTCKWVHLLRCKAAIQRGRSNKESAGKRNRKKILHLQD
jgi:hypothetical protein